MRKEGEVIAWFAEVSKEHLSLVGGKGANLGELTKANISVPPGFIVTAEAYYYFLRQSGLVEKIPKLLHDLDTNDSRRLQQVASEVKEAVTTSPMPPELARKIKQAYIQLGRGLVAVRSSATAEDLPEASFAGQQRTFLNVQGDDEVVVMVQECWASLFEPRAIFYRHQHNFDHMKVGIAVPVQRMIQSEASGVMFTIEPVSSDQEKIVIEAVFGLGETIVSGEVTPDLYIVDKTSLAILDKKVNPQEWQLIKNPGGKLGHEANIKVSVDLDRQAAPKLSDEDIVHLASLGKRIEDLYKFPQDVEWAKENGRFYVVQSRPVTALKYEVKKAPEIKGHALLQGVAASPGLAVGPVRLVWQASEIDRVKNGDILVAEMTSPDYVPAMKRAAAIVTDRGGRTAHAAIVSRELGIPCVVGTESATRILRDDQTVTIDGSRGRVYLGNLLPTEMAAPAQVRRERLKTTTKVYVNLADPELADRVAQRDVDGVGLLRAEFMIARIGEHPRYMLSQGRGEEFIERLAQGLVSFASAFEPRPVVYRTTDFKTNEYRNLTGGQLYEELEENPMLGYRGCSRYVRERDVFKLEIEAIKRVRQRYKNLWVMIPFVRTVPQMVEIKRILEEEGLHQSDNFKLWMMVEVPSNITLIDKFIDVGIDGISIGSNDLTQLILGLDRDSSKLAQEFDERNEAVLYALGIAIKAASRRGITSSICGQAPSFYPDLTEKLVAWGITSVSVSPDMIDTTREIIAEVERRLTSPSLWRLVTRSQD